ncbi:MAG TPA: S8 family serine peptidase, partial [Saprospiraceae bacterium]|nr:S8 family serine peptidase [Saprospiraceae bacterium]
EPNYIRSARFTLPDDQLFPLQWQLRNTVTPGIDISMTSAWDIIRGDGGLIIATLDSGVDYTHPDLAANIWRNPNEPSCAGTTDRDNNGYPADCRGWNFVGSNNNPMDDEGHGTHISGIIGAAGNNGLGIAGMIWDVKIMPLKFLDDMGNGTVTDEVAGIEYAIANGARIINASFAGDAFSNFERDAIAEASSAGILFVTAAGNVGTGSFGRDNDSFPVYPGNYNLPNIISVAATNQYDHIASFSNFGAHTVHVAAPGVSILSTVPTALHSLFCGGSPLSGYEYCDGTSMSAPHVTGLAGLILGYYGNLTPLQLRTMIMRYVDTLPTLQGIIISGGRINAYKTISALLPPTGLTANALSSTQVVLNWSDNATGENGYKIERRTSTGDFKEIDSTGPDITSYTDSKGLAPATEYIYKVRAFNTVPVDSPYYSNEASAITLSGPSPTPVPSSGGGGCSVGTRHTDYGHLDILLLLMPGASIILILRRRAEK